MKKKISYYVFMVLFLFMTLGPFIWTFIISITPEYGMFSSSPGLLPDSITWNNILTILNPETRQGTMFYSGVINSLKASLLTISIGIPSAVLSAYALTKMEFKGRKVIKNILLFTMAIPVMATIIPIYRIFSVNQILDNIFWLSVVYVSSFLPVSVWLISNYFDTIPKELEESAFIDGCSQMGSFVKIILPISVPAIISSVLIMFLSTWSQFQIPLILASSSKTKPIAVVTSEFMTKDAVNYGMTATAGLFAIVPAVLLVLFLKKYIISGMTGGAVKE